MNLKQQKTKGFPSCSKLQQLIKEVEKTNKNIKIFKRLKVGYVVEYNYLLGIKQTVEADNDIESAINKFYNREITMLEFDKFIDKWLEDRQELKKLLGIKQ